MSDTATGISSTKTLLGYAPAMPSSADAQDSCHRTVTIQVDHLNQTIQMAPPNGSAEGHETEASTIGTTITTRPLPVPPKDPKQRAEHPFQLIEKIAEGGMGEIWRAKQSTLERTIAVKRSKRKETDAATAEVLERQFTAEAVITGALQHPNILPVHDIARDHDGSLLLAMKEIHGVPWSSLLHPDRERSPRKQEEIRKKAARLSQRDHLRYFLSVCDAIAYAHSQGIIHRDLKPEQVMIGEYGETILLDWGIALPIPEASRGVDQITGTPAYMAPEMLNVPGAVLDERTDIYLLGGMLYEILTLKPPHDAPDWHRCLWLAAEGIVRTPSDVCPGKLIPTELERLALRCLAKHKEDRPQTVREVQDEISQFLTYKTGDMIEKDAFWEVFTGSQPSQERDVVIKQFAKVQGKFEVQEFADESAESGKARGMTALEAEARILRLFNHVYMPVLYDADIDNEGRPILLYRPLQGKNLGYLIEPHPIFAAWSRKVAMKFAEGQPQEIVDKFNQMFDEYEAGPFLTLEQLVSVLLKVCDALAYAHSFGIVHRHLRTTSIYCDDFGNATVSDWGWALDVRPEPRQPPIVAPSKFDCLGKLPAYSAPEIIREDYELINYWTDVYGLGGLLFESLCGFPPHWPRDNNDPEDYEETLYDVARRGAIAPPSELAALNRNVPSGLEILCMEALSMDPVERPTLEEFRGRLKSEWKKL